MIWTRRKLGMAGIPPAILFLASTALTWQWAKETAERHSLDSLNRQWAAMKGYLRIEALRSSDRSSAQWYYNVDDPDEAAAVRELRERSFIRDSEGRVLHTSPVFERIRPGNSPSVTSQMVGGSRYWIRAGTQLDDARR